MITHPRLTFNDNLTKLPLKLGLGLIEHIGLRNPNAGLVKVAIACPIAKFTKFTLQRNPS